MQQLQKYKKTELGEIPEDWTIDKLGNFVNILVGFPFASQEYSANGIRLVRGDNVTEGKLRWGERTKYWNKVTPQLKKFLLQKDDFLIGMDGSKVGRNYSQVKEEDLPCLLVQRVACLRTRKDLIQDYLNYIIGNKEFINYVESIKTNAAIPHISSRQISEYKFIVPTIKEQQKIASILSNVDELIQKTDQIIEQTQRFKKGLMQRLLTKGIGHTKFKKTELGEIPEPWELFKIEEIKSNSPNAITMGPFGSNITANNFVPSGVPVIRRINLTKEPFNMSGFVFLTDKKADELKSANAFAGDIVFTHRGTLGQVGLIPNNLQYKRYVVSQSQMKLACDLRKVEPWYVYYFFVSAQGQNALLSNAHGTGVPAIGQPTTTLKQIKIPVPPLNEQRRISNHLILLNKIIELERKRKNILECVKKGLMQQLLTGKIRVKV